MRTRHSAYSCEDIGWMIHFRFQILKRFLLFADLGVFSRSASASSCTVCQAYPEVRSVTSCDNSPTLHSTCCHFRLYLFELHNLQSHFWDMHRTKDESIPNDERSCLRRRKKAVFCFATERMRCRASFHERSNPIHKSVWQAPNFDLWTQSPSHPCIRIQRHPRVAQCFARILRFSVIFFFLCKEDWMTPCIY